MKDFGRTGIEIDLRSVPSGIGPTVMKESTTATIPLGHHIRVGCTGPGRYTEHIGGDPMILTIINNVLSQAVLPDKTSSFERKLCPHLGKVE